MPFQIVHNLIILPFREILFGGIRLSTLNTHTAKWLFVSSSLYMPCKNVMCFAIADF